MLKLVVEVGDYLGIFKVGLCLDGSDEFLHPLVPRAGILIDRNGGPSIGIDTVVESVDDQVESADLVSAGSCLNYEDAVLYGGLGDEGMGMAADYDINSPGRIDQ